MMMKRIFCLLAALLLSCMLLTACAGTPSSDKTDSSAAEEQQEQKDANGDYTVVSPSSRLAYKKACEQVEYELEEISSHTAMHLPRFQLPCNKQFYDRIEYAINVMKELTADYPATVYTYTTYSSRDYMEGTWQEVMKMNAGAIGAGWMKNSGWYQLNISQKQGEDLGYYAMTYSDTDRIFFEILDETLADYRAAGKELDEEAWKAFKNVCTRLVCVETNAKGYEKWSAWMSTTTDVDCRMIEQMYYDLLGEGIMPDGTNGNGMAIEQGRKPYKDVSTEDMKSSLQMIAARYNEMAEKYPALKPYADTYTAYVNAWDGVQ